MTLSVLAAASCLFAHGDVSEGGHDIIKPATLTILLSKILHDRDCIVHVAVCIWVGKQRREFVGYDNECRSKQKVPEINVLAIYTTRGSIYLQYKRVSMWDLFSFIGLVNKRDGI